ncbi:helix-turn-helix transcriptional regulator [Oscillibacter sp.]|uniref:helix-turn-helix domain-containing protein n=1 Tax=Oscillibacter sp. TaxID=1945593 RepID=UPI0026223A93|nr:helix-turn-helix transcriptional regulator [Oscillibacter sp.]MDD3347870.1 helix-turn-helix transcriptional regulator [Oscillibacter sp.]
MHEEFAARLSQLRMEKGVSARDMSLSIGQSAGYINNIENGNNLPSMTVFFYICEYLNISPRDFFDFKSKTPETLNRMIEDMKSLSRVQLEHLAAIIGDIRKP